MELGQFSYCSPTRGEYQTTTGPDGAFEFDVFVHDTDSITLSAQKSGYEPVEQRMGGFDCVAACPPVDLVLETSSQLH